MWRAPSLHRGAIWHASLLGMLFTLCAVMLRSPPASARGAATCSPPSRPGGSSVLVVLLDRSGSLTDPKGATDPSGYSGSITKALADLWPGVMVVIPFGDPHMGGANPAAAVLPVYRASLSDATQRDRLKAEVENYPVMGGTPLAPAMSEALDEALVPELAHPPPGSRAMIISDGGPTPTSEYAGATTQRQRDEIVGKQGLISQFAGRCVPVSPFGLKTDAAADELLGSIASGTGGTYTHVLSGEELSQKVVGLYKDWLGLSLSAATRDTDANYPVYVNDFASHASVVTFRSTASNDVALLGSDGRPVAGAQPRSIDRHYEIYDLNMSVFPTGIYKVSVGHGADTAAQVYALADHPRLHVRLLDPSQSAYAHQIYPIKAALFDGRTQYVPSGAAEMTAEVTYHPDSGAESTVAGTLQRHDATFSYQLPAYPVPGELRIQLHAKYQGIQEDSQVYAVPLLYVCTKGQWSCLVEQYQPMAIYAGIGMAFLLVALALLRAVIRRPFGELVPVPAGGKGGEREPFAEAWRPLWWKLARPATVASDQMGKPPGAVFKFRLRGRIDVHAGHQPHTYRLDGQEVTEQPVRADGGHLTSPDHRSYTVSAGEPHRLGKKETPWP